MRHYEFVQAVEANPVIAAIKDDEGLEQCLHSDIGSIVGIVKRLKDAGKVAMVHMDLISGLQAKDVSVDYIRNYTEADGIITTKFNLIQHARDIGLNTILRMFMLDSTSMDSFEKNGRSESVQPDIVEVLPGTLLPEVIQRLNRLCRVPVMVSGLITAKSEVYNALKNGAVSISTTNQALWFI